MNALGKQILGINNVGVRYIRDWLAGSTENGGNHWVEIKAFSNNVNVAFGKPATNPIHNGYIAIITNNNINSIDFYDSENYPNNLFSRNAVTIDLQDIYKLEKIIVWHYYADARTYYSTKTEVSADGINWRTVFDSAVSGTYVETSAGKETIL